MPRRRRLLSGVRDDNPGFADCMRYLREGDTLIVWRLDRLGRNMRSIVNTLHELTERGVTPQLIRKRRLWPRFRLCT
ncbi:MAG: recombinase family protein [Mycobacterium sp.]|uniref:recombinase family protein n=1 Tax=Mycobacterium sp. TaxID=1785 RepID=UPI003F967707